MIWGGLIRAELRKLTSTWMPWVFVLVLAAIAAINATAVIFGTDADGSKAFISTAADQQSLMAFAANAFIIAGLFGTMAVAREYGHGTVVPTFLYSPRRHRAVIAQYVAVLTGGAGVGLVGATLTMLAVALSLQTTEYEFMVSGGDVLQVLAASAFTGAAGAVLGAGLGALLRNTGGAVTATVLVLIVAPPLIVQLANEVGSWVPNTLANDLSGVTDDVGILSAIAALSAWAVVPAAIGLISVLRRDVV